MDIEDNLGDDVRIAPRLLSDFLSEAIKALRYRIFDYKIEYNREVDSTSTVVLLKSPLVPRPYLPLYLGESGDILDDN